MKPSTASKQQALFLNIYVLLFMLSVFLPRLFDTTAPYYRILTYIDLAVMAAIAAYLLFLAIVSWRHNIDKKTPLPPDFITFLVPSSGTIVHQPFSILKWVRRVAQAEICVLLHHVCTKKEEPFWHNKRGRCR